MDISETDRAYLAGIIDGEGSIGVNNHGGLRTPSIRITITNTNVNLLADLRQLWGGNLASWRKRRIGWKTSSDLIWGGSLATTRILKAILPYIRAKKEQCLLALEFNKTVNNNQTRSLSPERKAYRQELRKQMLQLNKRGDKHNELPKGDLEKETWGNP